MALRDERILTIDISSNLIKVGLVSDNLDLIDFETVNHTIINEDIDGFAKRFEMDNLWNKLINCIKILLKRNKTCV